MADLYSVHMQQEEGRRQEVQSKFERLAVGHAGAETRAHIAEQASRNMTNMLLEDRNRVQATTAAAGGIVNNVDNRQVQRPEMTIQYLRPDEPMMQVGPSPTPLPPPPESAPLAIRQNRGVIRQAAPADHPHQPTATTASPGPSPASGRMGGDPVGAFEGNQDSCDNSVWPSERPGKEVPGH